MRLACWRSGWNGEREAEAGVGQGRQSGRALLVDVVRSSDFIPVDGELRAEFVACDDSHFL